MLRPQAINKSQLGFTLLEMLITLTVLAILAAVALPNMSEFSAKQKMIGAAEQIYGHLQQARSEAITRSVNTFANFNEDGTATWQYAISTTNNCTLTITTPATLNACMIVVNDGDGTFDNGNDTDGVVEDSGDRVLMRFTSADYDETSLDISAGGPQFAFDSVRGTATAGRIDLTRGTDLALSILISALGRISICAPVGSAILNYGACP